ncbi:hypothetical protein ACFLYQ_00555 [Chloroflexota bacterium]
MSDKKRTAILVIHGVGAHTSFQACDSFVQGFCSSFEDSQKSKNKIRVFDLQHNLKQRQNWLGTGIPWVQNYVSYTIPETDNIIDFYEYFWDIYMVHEASFNDTFKMLSTASKSANEYYERYRKNHPGILERGTDLGEFGRRTKFGFGHPEFNPAGYLKLLGPLFKWITIISPYVPFLMKTLNKLSETRLPVLQGPLEFLSGWVKEPVPDFAGDLVRYLDLDPRSERFEIRRKIINGAVEELRALLKDDSYDRVIIAGHSLGSVIGYDALNRVIQEVSTKVKTGAKNTGQITKGEAGKIKGFISFGSPLDKIALFFRQHVKESKQIQKQVLEHLRGFRVAPMEEDKPGAKDKSEIKLKFNIDNPIGADWDKSIRWLNFYHKMDMISGKLDLYNLKDQVLEHQKAKVAASEMAEYDGNIEITDDFKLSVAHGCYWGAYLGANKGTNQMHETIIEEFFK